MRNIPAPGSTATGSFTTMHTEDLIAVRDDSAPMVRRATVAGGAVDATAQTVSFTFSVADGLVFNGAVHVFDAAGTYLGVSSPFRDPTTGAIGSILLDGVLYTDGTPNAVTVHAADLQLQPGASFAQIAGVRVLLTDGQQYAPGRVSYDCASVSRSATLTAQ